jgi:hypothetical protein
MEEKVLLASVPSASSSFGKMLSLFSQARRKRRLPQEMTGASSWMLPAYTGKVQTSGRIKNPLTHIAWCLL